ncbi:MAG: cytidylate kinase-like family protein [Clostridia bacterium]|nr:cytidylate kinase-like family protein [Clostridia bacterium]
MKKFIITIGRQYGSGGRMIGQKIAEDLGVKCYNSELLIEAAKESGLCQEVFEKIDEKPISAFLSFTAGKYDHGEMPLNHKVFLAQMQTIKKLAERESCVIVGRCADYVLRERDDVINVFISAPFEDRVKRVIERDDILPGKAEKRVRRIDKERSNYYNFYSTKRWGVADSYDVCLDSSKFGIEGCAKIIESLIK